MKTDNSTRLDTQKTMADSLAQLDAVARIASAFSSQKGVQVEQVLALVDGLVRRLVVADAATVGVHQREPSGATASSEKKQKMIPAVPVSEAVQQDKVYCLCCGKGFTMLKRHLRTEHGLSEDEYREMFSLPLDMPLVAPSYSARKAEFARQAGLGKHSRTVVASNQS